MQRTIVMLSGKRFSGKDFMKVYITQVFNDHQIKHKFIALADECKRLFALTFGHDFSRLLIDREYKEGLRQEMTKFYTEKVNNDKDYFKKEVFKQIISDTEKCIYIVTDLRHSDELEFFNAEKSFDIITLRISATDESKKSRGWIYNETVDKNITEVSLDDYSDWNLKFDNDGTANDCKNFIAHFIIPTLNKAK